jgi:hypothetical protein
MLTSQLTTWDTYAPARWFTRSWLPPRLGHHGWFMTAGSSLHDEGPDHMIGPLVIDCAQT